VKSGYVDISEDEFNQRISNFEKSLKELFDESNRLEGNIKNTFSSIKFKKEN
jgi:type I restriction enzyme M protein